MNFRTKLVLGTSSLALILTACNDGGGGGGGGGAEATENPINPVASGDQIFEGYEQVNRRVISVAGADGVDRTALAYDTKDGEKILVTYDASEDGSIVYNSVEVNGETVALGTEFIEGWAVNSDQPITDRNAVHYLAYTGVNGPSVIYTPYAYNYLDTLTEAGYKRTQLTGQTTFTEVPYEYSFSTGGTTWQTVSAADGQIVIDPASSGWDAVFGGATLDGSYQGKRLTGTATVNDIEGTFKGFDGYNPTSGDHTTQGIFVGGNGTDAFAGYWNKQQNLN